MLSNLLVLSVVDGLLFSPLLPSVEALWLEPWLALLPWLLLLRTPCTPGWGSSRSPPMAVQGCICSQTSTPVCSKFHGRKDNLHFHSDFLEVGFGRFLS